MRHAIAGLTPGKIDAHIERQPTEEKLTCNYCGKTSEDFVVDAETNFDHVVVCERIDCLIEAGHGALSIFEGVVEKRDVSKRFVTEAKAILIAFADYIG